MALFRYFVFVRQIPAKVFFSGIVGHPNLVVFIVKPPMKTFHDFFRPKQVLWHFYHQLVGDVYAFAFPVPHAEAVVGDYRVDVIFLDYFGRFSMFSPYLI